MSFVVCRYNFEYFMKGDVSYGQERICEDHDRGTGV